MMSSPVAVSPTTMKSGPPSEDSSSQAIASGSRLIATLNNGELPSSRSTAMTAPTTAKNQSPTATMTTVSASIITAIALLTILTQRGRA